MTLWIHIVYFDKSYDCLTVQCVSSPPVFFSYIFRLASLSSDTSLQAYSFICTWSAAGPHIHHTGASSPTATQTFKITQRNMLLYDQFVRPPSLRTKQHFGTVDLPFCWWCRWWIFKISIWTKTQNPYSCNSINIANHEYCISYSYRSLTIYPILKQLMDWNP